METKWFVTFLCTQICFQMSVFWIKTTEENLVSQGDLIAGIHVNLC